MPVTHGVTGSSPVRTAKANSKLKQSSEIQEIQSFFLFLAPAKMGTRNIRCISNFRVSAFSDLHHKNKKLSSNEWADRPPDRDKTGRRYRQNPRMSHAFYYEGSCKPSSHARGLNGSRRQTGEHTCVGRSFVIRFRELCAKLLCITHRT